MRYILSTALLLSLNFAPTALTSAQAQEEPQGIEKIQHIIVISLENHSFDNLFGHFPGADGLNNAGKTAIQTDLNGETFATLPAVKISSHGKSVIDTRFPASLPNKPFAIDQYAPISEKTGDLIHRFYQQQAQINGGRMDRFAAISDAGALALGYYDGSQTALWAYAQKYTLADRFFHAAFGSSFLNHFWLVCACTPRFENAPEAIRARLSSKGSLLRDGAVTPDGYAVNTIFSAQKPHPAGIPERQLLPPQGALTIGDRLSDKGISWAWYAGGWNNALAGSPHASFQYHHQPFAYFKRYGEGTAARKEHLKDETELWTALADGTLPAVSFYKPLGEFNLHPGYANVTSGDAHIGKLIQAIEESPVWESTVVIVTFDENGGYWDHVPPPVFDRWGPGMRVPTLVISPFARQGYVDHTEYDTTSILKLIEERYDLQPLSARDGNANSLSAALVFESEEN